MTYVIATALFLVLLFLLISLAKWTLKTVLIVTASVFAVLSFVTFFVPITARKPFNLNVIEKVLKINSDGSTSIIQTTTTTELKKK